MSPASDRCQRCDRVRILDRLGMCRRCMASLGPEDAANWRPAPGRTEPVPE